MERRLRVVFMGTSGFAVPSLRALNKNHQILAIVTQPDRPSGRGRHVIESPVKQEANSLGLPIYQPERVREEGFIEQMRGFEPLDAIVVAAFGQIIPKVILDMPRLGCVNVHGSLLPKYRGAAPIQHAILQGETVTGVTTMLMDPGLDTGPILLQESTDILDGEIYGDLHDRLAEIGARLLIRTLDGLDDGSIQPIPQDHSQATLALSIKREAGAIDWTLPAGRIVNQIRAFTPRPGAYAFLNKSMVKIWRAVSTDDTGKAQPGEVVKVSDEGILVATGDYAALITELQPENRRRMGAAEFARGARLTPGSFFRSEPG